MFRPVFSGPPQSWREWWSAVRGFAAGWYDIPPGEVTGYHPKADALGRELGVSLSPSLHEWVAFTDHLRQAGIREDALRDDSCLCWDSDTQSVLVMSIIEGNVLWTVRPEHLTDEDPPVMEWCYRGPDASPWRHWTPTTSQFALQHLIAYLRPAGGGFLLVQDVPWSDPRVRRLRNAGRNSVDLPGEVLIEDDDLVILAGKSLWSDEGQAGIDVLAVAGPGRAGSLPAPLVDLTRDGGMVGTSGPFLELRNPEEALRRCECGQRHG